MSDLPDIQELARFICVEPLPMWYVEVEDARKLLKIAKQQQAEIERLTRDLAECRRLLREAVEVSRCDDEWFGNQIEDEWFEAARKAAGGDDE